MGLVVFYVLGMDSKRQAGRVKQGLHIWYSLRHKLAPYAIGGQILSKEDDFSITIEVSEPDTAAPQRKAGADRVKQIRAKHPVSNARQAKADKQALKETGTIPLAPHHEAYVQAYLTSGNAIGSYRKTFGTKDGNGKEISTGLLSFRCSRLMKTRQIEARIKHLQATLAERKGMTREKLSDKVEQVMEQALYDADGELALKAVDRLARLHGLNQDKVKLELQTIDLNIDLGYSDEQITEMDQRLNSLSSRAKEHGKTLQQLREPIEFEQDENTGTFKH